jgi:hypothetical protein
MIDKQTKDRYWKLDGTSGAALTKKHPFILVMEAPAAWPVGSIHFGDELFSALDRAMGSMNHHTINCITEIQNGERITDREPDYVSREIRIWRLAAPKVSQGQ